MPDLRRENVGRARSAALIVSLIVHAVSSTAAFEVQAATPADAAPRKDDAPGGKTKPAAPLPAGDIASLQRKLASTDAADVDSALLDAQSAGPSAAALAPSVEELLRRGATPPLMTAAVKTLGALGQVTSSAVIRPYVRHRVPSVRHEAARALASTKGPDALAALRDALRSGDPVLRGLAASGLGQLGSRDALPELFLALDRDVPGSAAAIGLLCDPPACRKLLAKMGSISFDTLTSGLERCLLRPTALPEPVLLEIVERVRNLATPHARRFLVDVDARWPSAASSRIKAALEAAIAAIRVESTPSEPEGAPATDTSETYP
ncbi:HEAT repeat domain-containing protein [Chondromyces crocatus]|uniref:HEAT repeat domain-containing protein n=1 Tax=Chondromyces crocatus TaxID=52 RepID=A0A0K1E5V9_CHOCO|nr:HEAT repeat domain-containing protein [Chondromyces crocatus]AKT36266.1 uncharacterized protein CMC5_003800 [Chondromyces crocatus]